MVRMPLSAAEKQRCYRERRNADPEQRRLFLEKGPARWHSNKGKCPSRLPIGELPERDKRQKRRYWKRKKQESRTIQINQEAIVNRTPPESPLEPRNIEENHPRRDSGLRRQRQNRAKCYRDIDKLKAALKTERKNTEKYKKRYNRLKKSQSSQSPCSKTRQLLKHLVVNKTVEKNLTFPLCSSSGPENKFNETKQERKKQAISRMLTGKIVKRYRLQKFAWETFGFSQKRWTRFNKEVNTEKNPLQYSKKHKLIDKTCKMQKLVRKFYVRDDVSRSTAGKKETVTRHKAKMQKRFLCDTMRMLHIKFLSEHPEYTISYTLFCRLRSYWVVKPSVADRDTCLCKTHENLGFIVQKLRDSGILETIDMSELADSLACDRKVMACMYGQCNICAGNQFPIPQIYDKDQNVVYWQWVSEKSEKVTKSGKVKDQRITRKDRVSSRILDLVDDFQIQLRKFQRHVFNIKHQFSALRSLKEKLGENECLIQVDFAENYLCRYSTEIQAVHFRAFHQQVTLHDVVVQIGNVPEAIPMCTFSASSHHDPPAIWQYLNPVFEFTKDKFPKINTLHFYSDGPSTQYRQKKNFYLFSKRIFQLGFSMATWNFQPSKKIPRAYQQISYLFREQ